MVRRNLSCCSKEIKVLAYKSLVRPQLEYASSVWDPHTKKHCHKIEMVQRRSSRFIFSDYRFTSSPSDMINKLKLQSLETRRAIARLCIFYKAIDHQVALPLDDLRIPTRITRQSAGRSFIQLGTGCDTYKWSFFPRTIVDWNRLPNQIRSSTSINSFRSDLKSHFD